MLESILDALPVWAALAILLLPYFLVEFGAYTIADRMTKEFPMWKRILFGIPLFVGILLGLLIGILLVLLATMLVLDIFL
ncbi:hypothetical protein [Ruegeria meonggei]|uniref:Uncharacterized protein n=1 Tax=Ruegeria meonggei TaxID=1446476 RepID=A0A1X6YDH4_9RHOB|nr:hypothetical protein [Ruegeria meonggei]SLN18221.1 hypothetical protein RUM8411_00583 [Ruegeria meonggei]